MVLNDCLGELARERAVVVARWAIATSLFGAYLLLTALVSFPFLR